MEINLRADAADQFSPIFATQPHRSNYGGIPVSQMNSYLAMQQLIVDLVNDFQDRKFYIFLEANSRNAW